MALLKIQCGKELCCQLITGIGGALNLEKNKEIVLERIEKACRSANRDPSEIKIVWVSKTQDLKSVRKAIELGATQFGENRVQEALEKFLPPIDGIECRIIGPVQKNKLRKAVSVAQAIDSIADLESVFKLEALCEEANKNLEILFQVNASEEVSKSGLAMQAAFDFLSRLPKPSRLAYKGLMTIGKNTGNPEDSRACFAFLRNLRSQVLELKPWFANFTELSMGMTDDLEIAIAEGSTMVRIGTALFGKRDFLNSPI
ncbi:MAG: YggS family pyridoxal phosphate-dependent enzyme [Fibromonadaceae bacterium]|jgi:pyridoxal phosphate enzyme (YggS family)|nr:YggS family pyridoxal phosphate-dependent enzyme [Fibromonadaceae bacterium]